MTLGRRVALVAAIVTILSVQLAVAQQAERRTALVIGNSAYKSSPLRNPRADAEDMAKALRELGFTVTLKLDAGGLEMDAAIRNLGTELGKGGIGLFYFAGHGVQVEGRNYLIPVDADIRAEDEVRFKAIDAGLVLAKMETADNAVNIVILDACRDNPFKASFRSASRGLAVVEAPKGSLVVYATAPGTVAAEGGERNGVFTGALLKYMRTRDVEIEAMLKSVRQEVIAATGSAQVPWSSSSLTGGFYFAGKGSEVSQPPLTTKPMTPPQGKTGDLFITTEPTGAEVSLDGQKKGTSPLLIKDVPLGRPLRLEARAGNQAATKNLTLDKSGLTDMSLTLETEKGNLIVISTERSVRMILDGKTLGDLGSGIFRDVEAGRHVIELTASGVYWKGEVTVVANATVEMRAQPFAVGDIIYDLPSGVEASVSRQGSSLTIRGGGTLANLPAGRYDIVMSGSGYDTVRLSVDLARGESFELTPYRTLIAYQMVRVEGGTFQMGSSSGNLDEKPVHSVTVSSFFIGKYEVAQKEWTSVMGTNPSSFKGDDLPVEMVSWLDAVYFCNQLSLKAGLQPCYTIKNSTVDCDFSRNGYRLPTEAEWEYAARGGRVSKGYSFAGENDVSHVAWYEANSDSMTHPVGKMRANELGLYDMSGNVWEWCWDWYGVYKPGSQTDPQGPPSGKIRVMRGGSWSEKGRSTFPELTYRAWGQQGDYNNIYGLRLARTAK